MAILGPDYKFTCAAIRGCGKNSDAGIFEQSIIERFKSRTLNIAEEKPLPEQKEPAPHAETL
jgi:hypothetical protein